MKNVFKLLMVAVVIFFAGNLFAQYTSTATQFPFIEGPMTDVAPQCSTGIKYDDGTFENGYGWNPGFGTGKWVMKMTPTSYPYTINQVCVSLTRTTGPATWPFDIEFWDTTGTGGGPGTLVHSITGQSATNVPVYPSFGWYDFTGLSGIPALQNGSYYVGISYTPVAGWYVGADQSTTTPLRPGYAYIQSAWSTIATYFPSYRAMGIRVEGSGVVLAHDYAVGPFLSLPTTFSQGNNYNIKARVRNIGSSNETSVPIKFFVDNTQTGTVNLSLNAGATDSVTFPWVATSGNHTLRIFSELSTDLNRANDTVRQNIVVLAGTPTYGGTVNVCRTGINVPILDNATARDSLQITIPTWGFGIQDVNVTIQQVVHTWDSDLEFRLLHGGVDVNIIDNVGGSGDNFINTVLNDSAATPIASGTAPFTGSFRPSNPLAGFNSQTANPNGYWTLTIADGASGDTGSLNAWCVTLNYYTYVGGIGSVTIPNYYALGQNYPNPFNPSTKIKYALPEAGNVKLIIFDILGREITTLVNEYHTSGIYEVDFNGTSLASGIYFYRIEAGSFTDTKKMLLVK